MYVETSAGGCSVKAYRGDAKTLLAMNISKTHAKDLAGFTVGWQDGTGTHYASNSFAFEHPDRHSQDPAHAPNSSVNAPLHRFRWVHVPGAGVLGEHPAFGTWTYLVTPRFLDDGALLPLDPSRTVTVEIDVAPFTKGALTASFTRGFTQSQAFVHNFGSDARFRPDGDELTFATSETAGTTPSGHPYTWAQEYAWLGFTARPTILDLLAMVQQDKALRVDVFAYDLNEPDIVAALLALAGDGRVRVILDNAALHHTTAVPPVLPEDRFAAEFAAAAIAPAELKRGHFARYSHDKVMIVYRDGVPMKVLTGSTNFSVTGLYVNSNHVLVFDEPDVAATYATVFDAAWASGVRAPAFRTTPQATAPTEFSGGGVPRTSITFSPHSAADAAQILDALSARITAEAEHHGSVLFAVMGLEGGGSVYPALQALHADTRVFSYGISDTTSGIALYSAGHPTGVLVTGKPGQTDLPPPFDQVPSPERHQVHHKFVVCGFNGPAPVVYCGSSNLALGGEQENGDNLLEIHDRDVATVFAIEAVTLVDHFDFLDRFTAAAAAATKPFGPWLSITDHWTHAYYDPNDLHFVDREFFA